MQPTYELLHKPNMADNESMGSVLKQSKCSLDLWSLNLNMNT